MDTKNRFLNHWVRNNILACFIGLGLLHPIIAHGFTGDHGISLTIPQLIMHTVSLFVFAAMLTYAQNKALQIKLERKTWDSLLLFLLLIPVFFWTGYYTLYIPFDILFTFLTIGVINAVTLRRYMVAPGKWPWQIMLSMFCGAVAGIGAGIGCYFWFIKDMKGLAGDFTIWTLISVPAAVVFSLVSKYFLRKQVA